MKFNGRIPLPLQLLFTVCCCLSLSVTIETITERTTMRAIRGFNFTEYLVNGRNCTIVRLPPNKSPVNRYFKPIGPTRCSTHRPLSGIVYNTERSRADLVLFTHRLREKTLTGRAQCKYWSVILTAEKKLVYSDPEEIAGKPVALSNSTTSVFVVCRDAVTKLIVYKNAHSVILKSRDSVRRKLEKGKAGVTRKLGIIMLQLNSLSEDNFERSMPKVAQFLRRTGWFSLLGHHKVALDTYQNMNAILAGGFAKRQTDELRLWRDFNRNGYVTAYSEDLPEEAFEYYTNRTDFESMTVKSFLKQLPGKFFRSQTICNWSYSVFELVYDQMIDFATTFRGERYLGLFVSSAYTDAEFSGGSALELHLLRYLKKLERLRIREDAIILLYSDHGMNHGKQRRFVEGGREDSMPLMMISLPQWFQEKNPKIAQALTSNRNKLTSHYDLHLTLKHIIELNEGTPLYRSLRKCPECQSLFEPVPVNRRCIEAGIPINFCYCDYQNWQSSFVRGPWKEQKKSAANALVEYMNKRLEAVDSGTCRRVTSPKSHHAFMTDNVITIVFKTNLPYRLFEGSVVMLGEGLLNVSKIYDVPRNLYSNDYAMCGHADLKEYCVCSTAAETIATATTTTLAMWSIAFRVVLVFYYWE